MFDKLFPEDLHQTLVQLVLDWCPIFFRIVKYQQMLLHFRGSFRDPVEVMIQCSWSAIPVVFYVYNMLIE